MRFGNQKKIIYKKIIILKKNHTNRVYFFFIGVDEVSCLREWDHALNPKVILLITLVQMVTENDRLR